jgi:hypothetical protein
MLMESWQRSELHVCFTFSYYKLILSLHSPCGDKVHIATTCLVPCLVSFTVKKEKRNCERFRQNLNLGGAVRLPYPGTGDGDSKGPCGHESRISSHRGRFGFIKGGHWKKALLSLRPHALGFCSCSLDPHPLLKRVTMSAFVGKYTGSFSHWIYFCMPFKSHVWWCFSLKDYFRM